jgi:hypothetical protein
MSIRITKRALSAGFGAGALALMAEHASADTPFLNFAFPVTGGTARRTMPDRLVDIINVKDFGADATGVSDSATAIQNAINAAMASGSVSARQGGMVFFPPGSYLVNGQLTAYAGSNTSVSLVGSGRGVSKLVGTNNSGFIVKGGTATFEEIMRVEGLSITNLSTTPGTGAASIIKLSTGDIVGCEFSGYIGLEVGYDSFNTSVRNCIFTGTGIVGSVGCNINQIGVYDCKFTNWDWGLTVNNGGPFVSGCSFDSCRRAILLGYNQHSTSSAVAFAILSTVIKNCDYGIYSDTATDCGLVAGVQIKGTTGVAGAKPQYGMYLDNISNVVFDGCTVTAQCDQYGIYCGNYGCTFINTTSVVSPGSGQNWRMPTVPPSWNFINSNNPTNAFPFSLLGAASAANEGAIFDVVNVSIASDGPGGGQWGGTCSSGAPGIHARVRSNGMHWTAVGV